MRSLLFSILLVTSFNVAKADEPAAQQKYCTQTNGYINLEKIAEKAVLNVINTTVDKAQNPPMAAHSPTALNDRDGAEIKVTVAPVFSPFESRQEWRVVVEMVEHFCRVTRVERTK